MNPPGRDIFYDHLLRAILNIHVARRGVAWRGVEMGVYVFVCLCGRRVLCGEGVTHTDASSRACGSPVTILLGQR